MGSARGHAPLFIINEGEDRGKGQWGERKRAAGTHPQHRKKEEKKASQLRTTGSDVAIDVGFGIDIYYPLFKFSPELRFSLGLKNLHNKDENIYSSSIQELKTYTVTLYLLFE